LLVASCRNFLAKNCFETRRPKQLLGARETFFDAGLTSVIAAAGVRRFQVGTGKVKSV
jgi:hypothetical protein